MYVDPSGIVVGCGNPAEAKALEIWLTTYMYPEHISEPGGNRSREPNPFGTPYHPSPEGSWKPGIMMSLSSSYG
tara:strand:+ start:1127 stop:1348 length:222 start_codon:yes stop_codon:yes gene_type:complete